MVIVVKYNIETISRGVVSHLNLDQRYKPVEFEDIMDLVTVLVRLNQPTRIDDFAFTDKVAAAITRTPKTYATETLLKKTSSNMGYATQSKSIFVSQVVSLCHHRWNYECFL